MEVSSISYNSAAPKSHMEAYQRNQEFFEGIKDLTCARAGSTGLPVCSRKPAQSPSAKTSSTAGTLNHSSIPILYQSIILINGTHNLHKQRRKRERTKVQNERCLFTFHRVTWEDSVSSQTERDQHQ